MSTVRWTVNEWISWSAPPRDGLRVALYPPGNRVIVVGAPGCTSIGTTRGSGRLAADDR